MKVYRLSEATEVAGYTPYARNRSPRTLPKGTYWVPMAQRQKHWIQAMLNEDTYVPFPYFYDVTAWSQPLLFNLPGGYTGARLEPRATLVKRLAEPSHPDLPSQLPKVGLYQMATSVDAIESAGWLRYLLERAWDLPYRDISAEAIISGRLAAVDVLLVPNGSAFRASHDLGPAGRDALVQWVNEGGRLVAWRGGAELAARLGITTAALAEPTSDIPGSLLRVRVNRRSPLGAGVGRVAWAFYEYDNIMRASDPDHVAAAFPPASSDDFFVSGFADGEEELGGTAAVIDEPVGTGRAILFSFDPDFRGYTDGTQKFIRNAILGPDPSGTRRGAAAAGAPSRAKPESAAKSAARQLVNVPSPVRISVAPSGAPQTETLIRSYTNRFEIVRSPGKVSFLIANRRGLSAEEHPFARAIATDLRVAGVPVIAFHAG